MDSKKMEGRGGDGTGEDSRNRKMIAEIERRELK